MNLAIRRTTTTTSSRDTIVPRPVRPTPSWEVGGPLGWYRSLLRRIGHYGWFPWLGVHVLTPLDKWLYPRFRGRIVSAGPMVLPGLMLTTTGRRTGRPRTTPLLYLQDGADVVVVGGNFGQRHHPAWTYNLLAEPRAAVWIGEGVRPVTARLATPDERAKLWPRLLRIWPAIRTYSERSGRSLRVFVLSPRVDETGSASAGSAVAKACRDGHESEARGFAISGGPGQDCALWTPGRRMAAGVNGRGGVRNV